MKGIALEILPKSKLISTLGNNVFDTLIIALACSFLVWYAQYHWKRRKLYQMAAQRNGPLTLPFIGNALYFIGSTSDILNNALRLAHDFESPVRVWLGQRLFFGIFEAKDLETIMNSPHALNKEELYKYAEVVVGTGLFTAPASKWKRHRKLIMPTFNQKILDGFVVVFSQQSEILVEKLKKEVGNGTFDIVHYVGRCSLDIVCETTMGIRVNAQSNDCNFDKWANTAMEIIFTRMFCIFYHSDFIFNRTSLAKTLYDVTEKMHAFTGAIVKEKRIAYQKKLKERKELPESLFEEETSKRKNFLQLLIELSEDGAHFTDEELREEVDTFMIAGSDTTASVNSFILVMLGLFPEVQDKVYEEVIDVLGLDRAVQYDDLGKLQYLERVIKETMRLFPIGPLLVRSITEDIKLEKCTIPGGSSVVMFIIGMHRDPNLWPDPLKFDPDRFLPDEVAKRHPYSYLPFSGGPRNCVGPKYGMMSMKTLIATVVRKYRLSTDYKDIEDVKLKADLLLKPVNGYRVSIEFRK